MNNPNIEYSGHMQHEFQNLQNQYNNYQPSYNQSQDQSFINNMINQTELFQHKYAKRFNPQINHQFSQLKNNLFMSQVPQNQQVASDILNKYDTLFQNIVSRDFPKAQQLATRLPPTEINDMIDQLISKFEDLIMYYETEVSDQIQNGLTPEFQQLETQFLQKLENFIRIQLIPFKQIHA